MTEINRLLEAYSKRRPLNPSSASQTGSSLFSPAKAAAATGTPPKVLTFETSTTYAVREKRHVGTGTSFLHLAEESSPESTAAVSSLSGVFVVGVASVGQAFTLLIDHIPTQRIESSLMRRLSPSDATAFSNVEIVRGSWKPRLDHYVNYLRSIFRRDYGAALATRLVSLEQMTVDDEDQSPLSVLSVSSLIAFLEKNKITRPNLVAGPSGEIIAIWRREGEGEFSARFLDSGAVKFMFAKRSSTHPSGLSRSSGDTTVSDLFTRAGLSDAPWVLQ